jgi:2-dehydro-3-deoxy-D-gluconate 5-dehydrogenase
MSQLFDLSGKAALVTGASRGLGAGMAEGLAEAGADVAVVASGAGLKSTREKILALGRRCEAIQADLSAEGAVSRVMEAALAAFGRVDILVNCAGVIRRAPAIEFSAKDWDEVINLNLRSLFFLCQAAAKDMMTRGGGKIINIASLLSFQGGIIVPSYTASKSAVMGLTKALANEWAPHGINVNAIAPGYMATEMTEALQKNAQRAPSILARIPQGRWGTPQDMKGAAVFLASSASDYVQGHTLVVDGGWMAR